MTPLGGRASPGHKRATAAAAPHGHLSKRIETSTRGHGFASFSFPAATSIFVYRKASPGVQAVCSCAEADGVQDSGLHVWLYAHQDERGESYRWSRQSEVKTGAHKQDAVLSEHLIYQRFAQRRSNGPPMRRCTQGQGTEPDTASFYEKWTLSQPAEICANRLRCQHCGLHQQLKHFSRARDGTEPRVDATTVRDEGLEFGFEEFCTVWCKFCNATFFRCSVCEYHYPQEDYTESMWHHRFERGATCSKCEAEKHLSCEVCGTEVHAPKTRCQICGKLKVKGQYSPSMWLHRLDADRSICCLECEAQTPSVRCDTCNMFKPAQAFSASALRHSSTQTTRCHDCSSPPCMFRPKCPTCSTCRDPTCKTPNCTKAIKTVNSKQLPASAEDVANFACDRCRYVRCIVKRPDGTVCGKERRRNAQAKARKSKTAYSCGDCQTWLLSQETLHKDAASSSGQ